MTANKTKANALTDFAMFSNAFNMSRRESCLIYQDNINKLYWDIYITSILLLIVIIMPYHIAFNHNSN